MNVGPSDSLTSAIIARAPRKPEVNFSTIQKPIRRSIPDCQVLVSCTRVEIKKVTLEEICVGFSISIHFLVHTSVIGSDSKPARMPSQDGPTLRPTIKFIERSFDATHSGGVLEHTPYVERWKCLDRR